MTTGTGADDDPGATLSGGAAGGEDAILRRLKEIDATPTRERELRGAVQLLSRILERLPGPDYLLLDPKALEAWRILREGEDSIFALYIASVRQKCGYHIAELVQDRIRSSRPGRQSVRLIDPVEIIGRPAPLERVRGWFPERGVVGVYGEPGTGKSFFALDVVCSIARGDPWHGKRVRFAPAVIIQAEGSIALRLRVYSQMHAIDFRDIPLRVVEQALDLRTPGATIPFLIDAIAGARPEIGAVRVLLIDTFARTFGAGNESASDDMAEYLGNLDVIARAIDGLVIVVHHAGKDASKGARGHSSFRAALDTEIELTRDSSGVRTARVTKSRDGGDGAEFSFRLKTVDLGPHPDPDADPDERLSSCIVEPCHDAPGDRRRFPTGKNQMRAYDAIAGALTAGQQLLHVEAVRLVKTTCSLAYNRAWEAVNSLIDGGFLLKDSVSSLLALADK